MNMKNYLMLGLAAALIVVIIFCINKEVQADTITVNYTNTNYDYSFPANVFLDDSSNGLGITYGFSVAPNWSIDIGYKDLGSAEQTTIFIPTKFDVELLTLALHGNMVIGTMAGHDVKAHGMIGAARGDADLTIGVNQLSDADMGLLYGVGLSVNLSAMQSLGVMYSKADLSFNNTGSFDYDPSMFEINYSYYF